MSAPYPTGGDRSGVSLRQKKNRRQAIQGDAPLPYPNGRQRPQMPPPALQPSQSSGISQTSQSRPSQESTRSAESRPRPRPKANDTTSNLVKKRYSVRYGQAPDLSQSVPAVPGLPSVPRDYLQENRSNASLGHQRKKSSVDMRALRDPNLQPGQYVAGFLATASEQDLAEYQQDLRSVKNRASTDLQRNVQQNRTQFIKISKEAERLKGEMQTLQGLMNDLTITLEQATVTSGSQRDDTVRKRNNRSSVANLEAMWSTQLQALWKAIEGSQKFVAAIPGRHVILEQGGWIELDAATYRARKPTHLVLLNDNLLIAARRRKRIDPNQAKQGQKAPTKIVAERCFPIQEIDIIEITLGGKDPYQQHISHAISIRHGAESFTYRREQQEGSQRKDFMFAFKRAVEEIRRTEQAENEANNKAQDTISYLVTRDVAVSSNQGLMRSLSKSKERPDILVDVDGKQHNMRWVEGQIDELDIEIALQHFEEAVTHIELLRNIVKGLKGNSVAQDLVNAKVNERTNKLADILTSLLSTSSSLPAPTLTYTKHLTRLSLSARARTTYLASRTSTISQRSRSLIFSGNILSHITALSYVYFTLIRNTVSTFQTCFPPSMMSACVSWAKGQLDGFNAVLERVLSGVERGGVVYREGLGRARELAGVMDEVGLDFGGLVGEGLD